MPLTQLKLDQIRRPRELQPRAQIEPRDIEEYTLKVEQGVEFTPVQVCHDGTAYWLWDGFHTCEAYGLAQKKTIMAHVRPGTKRDAFFLSRTKANTDDGVERGIRRNLEDQKRAAKDFLLDAEWGKWSDRKIAELVGISNDLVGDLRREIEGIAAKKAHLSPPTDAPKSRPGASGGTSRYAVRTVVRGGKTYTMDTTGIAEANKLRRAFARWAERETDNLTEMNCFPALNARLIRSVEKTLELVGEEAERLLDKEEATA